MVIGNDGFYNIEWTINGNFSDNNIVFVQGKTGMGKTTFSASCVNGACEDGVPCIVFDYSDSYQECGNCFSEDKVMYYNVAEEEMGINPFKRKAYTCGEEHRVEDVDSAVYRITEMLAWGLRITAKSQKVKLQQALYKQYEDEGEAASVPYLYASLAGTELGERIRCISKCNWYSDKLNWKDILKKGKILVIQLSDIDRARRYIFTEMLLMDLWIETLNEQVKDYLVCLDEIQNLNLGNESTVQQMVREGRKYGVAMIVSTQFVGKLRNDDAKLALEQAGKQVFFKPPEEKLATIAKSIDYKSWKRWIEILQNLDKYEFIFAGDGIVDGVKRNLKCVLKCKSSLETVTDNGKSAH